MPRARTRVGCAQVSGAAPHWRSIKADNYTNKNYPRHIGMCATLHLYMRKRPTVATVDKWFHEAVRDLWPIAIGSLSLRKSPCIREHCAACESGAGHSSYALYGRKGKQRFSVYVPIELVPSVERALENGRLLQELMMEAGRRYTLALKDEHQAQKRRSTPSVVLRSKPGGG
jgi:hypothetical protein